MHLFGQYFEEPLSAGVFRMIELSADFPDCFHTGFLTAHYLPGCLVYAIVQIISHLSCDSPQFIALPLAKLWALHGTACLFVFSLINFSKVNWVYQYVHEDEYLCKNLVCKFFANKNYFNHSPLQCWWQFYAI